MNEPRSYHAAGRAADIVGGIDPEAFRKMAEFLSQRTPPTGPLPTQRHGSLRRRLGFWLVRLGRRVAGLPKPDRPRTLSRYVHIHGAFPDKRET